MTSLLLLFGVSFLLSGVAMLRQRPRSAAAALVAGGGVGFLTAGLVERPSTAYSLLITLTVGCLAPTAVAAYPTVGPRVTRYAATLAGVTGAVAAATAPYDPATSWSCAAAAWGIAIATLWWRFERCPDQRHALQWLGLALAATSIAAVVLAFALTEYGESAWWIAGLYLLVPPAAWWGRREQQPVDVRAVVAGATVTITGILVLLALLSAVASLVELRTGEPADPSLMLLMASTAAVLYHPIVSRLRGTVDQVLFGRRPQPASAADVATRGNAADTATALDQLRQALLLPSLALSRGNRTAIGVGEPAAYTHPFPVRLSDDDTVTVTVGLRPGDLRLTDTERDVLSLAIRLLLARESSDALAVELARARVALNAAVAEERRRLRRDLHDGLGPHLTGLAYSADAILNRLPSDDPVAPAVRAIREDAARMIADIRSLVAGLRPRAIDELGLVGAWQQLAESGPDHSGHGRVRLRGAPPTIGPLPAHLEVAAYRIVAEALTNAAKHAPEAPVRLVWLLTPHFLRVRVSNPVTAPGSDRRGVGLNSMRERAVEAGGVLTAETRRGRWVVEVQLPLQQPPPSQPMSSQPMSSQPMSSQPMSSPAR